MNKDYLVRDYIYRPKRVLIDKDPVGNKIKLILFIIICGFILYKLSSLLPTERIHCLETTNNQTLCQ